MEFDTSGILSTATNIRPIGPPRQCTPRRGLTPRIGTVALLALALAGCGTVRSAEEAVGLAGPSASDAQLASRYLGSIAADDTEAVDLARRVLLGGGTAADAATEIALALMAAACV
jgi:hypothetical protein